MVRSVSTIDASSVPARHETRTRLAVIRGYAQLLQRHLADPRPFDRMKVKRGLVAIEQASRALEASLDLDTREQR